MSRGQTQSNDKMLADAVCPGPGSGPADPSACPLQHEGEPKRGGAPRSLEPKRGGASRSLELKCGGASRSLSDCPSRPALTVNNKSTQTPGPSGQTVSHMQQQPSAQGYQNQEQQNLRNQEELNLRNQGCPAHSSGGGVQQPERWVGQELRRIGDEMNQEYTHRGRSRWISHSLDHWLGLLLGRLLQILFRCR